MPALTLSRFASLMGGSVIQGGDLVAESIIIDSREARPGALFFAIRGDRLDGHTFIEQALEKSIGAVVHVPPFVLRPDKGYIRVADTTIALQQLARSIRENFPFLLIAITGSAGKTTTKEMISTLVETERRTWRSSGNFNNHIGFPLCMANTPDGSEVVVSEMGMNHAGEIAFLAGLSYPDIGVYTNIKPVHLEFFGTLDGIAAAKRELLENVKPDGLIVINADDAKVMEISAKFPGRKVTYAVDSPADYRALDVSDRGLLGSRFTLEAEGGRRSFELTLPGRHNLENFLAAIATARASGISWKGVERGAGQIKPAYHRGVVVEWKGARLYDDTYNSNPYALGRSLELFDRAECSGKRIAVIGDMLELGPDELQFHHEAGRAIPRSVDTVVAVGPRSLSLLEGARENGFDNGSLHHFGDALAAADFLKDMIQPGDLVLLKASRGIGLDRVITALEKEA